MFIFHHFNAIVFILIKGIAHFLEHMLFMGTEKYPDENEYSKFLSAHGGASNAYTDSEDTVYYFDVNQVPHNSSENPSSQYITCWMSLIMLGAPSRGSR